MKRAVLGAASGISLALALVVETTLRAPVFDFRSAASAPWLLSSVPPGVPVVIAVALFGVLGALFGRRGREDLLTSVSSLAVSPPRSSFPALLASPRSWPRSREHPLLSCSSWASLISASRLAGERPLGISTAGDFSRRARVLLRHRILDFDQGRAIGRRASLPPHRVQPPSRPRSRSPGQLWSRGLPDLLHGQDRAPSRPGDELFRPRHRASPPPRSGLRRFRPHGSSRDRGTALGSPSERALSSVSASHRERLRLARGRRRIRTHLPRALSLRFRLPRASRGARRGVSRAPARRARALEFSCRLSSCRSPSALFRSST